MSSAMNSETTVIEADFSPFPRFSWSPTLIDKLGLCSSNTLHDPQNFDSPRELFLIEEETSLSLMEDKLNTIYIDGELNGSPVLCKDPNLFSVAVDEEESHLNVSNSFNSIPDAIQTCGEGFKTEEDRSYSTDESPLKKRRIFDDEIPPSGESSPVLNLNLNLSKNPANLPCAFCERHFTTKSNLTRHYRTMHPRRHCVKCILPDKKKNCQVNLKVKGKRRRETKKEKELKRKLEIRECSVVLNKLDVEKWRLEEEERRRIRICESFPKMINVVKKTPIKNFCFGLKNGEIANGDEFSDGIETLAIVPFGDDVVVNEIVIGEELPEEPVLSFIPKKISDKKVLTEKEDEVVQENKKNLLAESVLKPDFFDCDICGLKFKVRSCLVNHKKFAHGSKLAPRINCDNCGDEYNVLSDYTKHIQRCRGNETNGDYVRNLFEEIRKTFKSQQPKTTGNQSSDEIDSDESVKPKRRKTTSGYYSSMENVYSPNTVGRIFNGSQSLLQESSRESGNFTEEKVETTETKFTTKRISHRNAKMETRSESDLKNRVRRKRGRPPKVKIDNCQLDEYFSSSSSGVVDDSDDQDFVLSSPRKENRRRTKMRTRNQNTRKKAAQRNQTHTKMITRSLPHRKVKRKSNFSLSAENSNELPPKPEVKEILTHFPKFKCEKCGKGFLSQKGVTCHGAIYHCHNSTQCPLCFRSVNCEQENLVDHMMALHLRGTRWNREMGYSLVKAINEKKKTKDLVEKELGVFYCRHCGILFPTPEVLMEHRKEEEAECSFKCARCGWLFKSEGSLSCHLARHVPFFCRWCKEKFENVDHLLAHQKGHKEEHSSSEEKESAIKDGQQSVDSEILNNLDDLLSNISQDALTDMSDKTVPLVDESDVTDIDEILGSIMPTDCDDLMMTKQEKKGDKRQEEGGEEDFLRLKIDEDELPDQNEIVPDREENEQKSSRGLTECFTSVM